MPLPIIQHPGNRVLLRDFVIFWLKLVMDGLKDVLLLKLSLFGVVVDLLFNRPGRPLLFYQILRLSERFDLWLNLNGAATSAGDNEDGLFGESEAGSPSMLGKLEQWVRGRTETV